MAHFLDSRGSEDWEELRLGDGILGSFTLSVFTVEVERGAAVMVE
jgi:hypothetical protein